MKHRIRSYTSNPVFAAVAAATFLLTACGGEQSMASKSAAAFREAQAKETSVAEPSHGGHAATPRESATTSTDHTGMSAIEQAATPDMDHSMMAGMGHDRDDTQHEKAPHGQHGRKTPGDSSPTPMEHGSMQHGMQHGETTSQRVGMAEVRQVEAQPGQPASTLEPDSLDAPAPTSVGDAARSAEMAKMMASPGHAMAHGAYVHQDVGRGPVPMQHVLPSHDEAPVFACPMHSDVKSSTPGTCPKCGMTLVKKETK
ncbi:MAG: hypothetical protein NDJ92_06665 [Thermoanaerobaculia bacterium]|nr:hypothetical protein [Thermoanaerobaculia bacterium]